MQLDDYKNQLALHDWTHAMSDDHRVYIRGRSSEVLLQSIAETHGEEFKRAFNEAHQKAWKTETKPFPEVAP